MNGQQLVEYVLLVAGIIAAFAAFVGAMAVMERKRGRRQRRG